ncbi:helix-turn-helix domain-containing protein [Paenibacillus sp. CC-CFT747]|nr:helix-turn-helix domain-containing protein [Paenibacillus sp. CC-CFT747]
MSLEEIEAKIHYLHLGIDTRDLVVMALSVDAQGERSTAREEDANLTEDLLKLQVQDLLSRNPVLSTPYYVVEAEENLLALVLARRGMDEEQVLTLARQLLKQINGELNHSYSIGIGSACATVKELPQSYEEALETLKYRILYGSGDVLSFGEIQFDQTSRFHYPKLKEEQLLGYLKTARVEEAIQAFDEFVSDINAQKNNLHYKQIQPVFVQLLTVIIYSLNQLGVNWRTVWQKEANPYQELLDQESLSQIVRWFHQLIRLTAAYLEGEWNAKGNQHITRVIEILERDYSQPLSLSSVAEQVNLNPAYISRLFKQIKGEPFVDYLKKVRIEKSKELLLQSSMKIGEAGKEVGYSHSYYFIKVFKEEVGLTPGEFKRLYGS